MTKERRPYWELLRDPQWQRKRLEVMQRANFKCERCGDASSTLNVHHTYYTKGAMPWDYPDEALKCWCEPCHEYWHKGKYAIDLALAELGPDRLKEVVRFLLDLVNKNVNTPIVNEQIPVSQSTVREYEQGQSVIHENYGIGLISGVESYPVRKVKISFKDGGGERTFLSDKVKLKVIGPARQIAAKSHQDCKWPIIEGTMKFDRFDDLITKVKINAGVMFAAMLGRAKAEQNTSGDVKFVFPSEYPHAFNYCRDTQRHSYLIDSFLSLTGLSVVVEFVLERTPDGTR